jgi:hypothetical protein
MAKIDVQDVALADVLVDLDDETMLQVYAELLAGRPVIIREGRIISWRH